MAIQLPLRMVRSDCDGWLSPAVARTLYQLAPKEFNLVKRELKEAGAYCPRKGFSINALERCVPRMRMEVQK